MFGGLVLVMVLVVVVVPALLVGLVLWLVSRSTSDDGGAPARAARRHELLVSSVAVLAAVVCTVVLLAQPVAWPGWASAPGVLQAITPFSVALVLCVVRAVGEQTWPRPRGEVRSAPLARRTIWSLGGARLRIVLVTAAALAVALVVFGATADPTGRAFATNPVTLPDGSVVSGASGPYPGWPYGLPMLLGLALAVAATFVALGSITRRPPLHGVPARHDDAVRATSAARLLGAVQLCLGVGLGGALAVGGAAIQSRGQNLLLDELPTHGLVAVGGGVALLGIAVVVASGIAGLLAAWPRAARHAGAPAATGAPA